MYVIVQEDVISVMSFSRLAGIGCTSSRMLSHLRRRQSFWLQDRDNSLKTTSLRAKTCLSEERSGSENSEAPPRICHLYLENVVWIISTLCPLLTIIG